MLQNISAQIENINKSLEWIKKNKPEDYQTRFLQLMEERRKLRKLEYANQENPAIAAYGVSQVGKSYLMNSVLQQDSTPFMIEADGRTYRFIEEMNPQTKNTEATGVVTRFTSYKRRENMYSKEYPIMMRCLSAKDTILVVSDGYYNDISDYTTYSESEINDEADRIYQKYISQLPLSNAPLQAEDILDIKAYYAKHINNAQTFLNTSFFDKLALVIGNIPVSDYTEVFSILWHRSSYQTKVFEKMISTLEKFGFAQFVYLPASALLHNGINENTIMSVQCLNELFLEKPTYFTDVFVRKGDDFTKVPDLTKSEVCAVCAEIIVKITEQYLEHSDRYCLDDITDPVVRGLITADEVKMDILRNNDLLDFPGARTRKKEQLETLRENAILINVLLRGKVAYLFNMYNEARLINILLYCHHNEQNEVTDIPLLLKNWIMTYVGDSVEKRAKTLELTGGISPLFYIATKFNIDMQLESAESANSENSLHGRWQQRFYKVLYQQCFNADGCLDAGGDKIFFNWTRSGETFSNSFLLRDFKYSGPLYSKLYEFEKNAEHPTKRTVPEEYYARMRETFCSDENVRRFFHKPSLAWDVACSVDNDGALYVIEQLSKVAKRMDSTREHQFEDILHTSVKKVLDIMKTYYHSTDLEQILDGNTKKALDIMRELDFTCNIDNYYFGHLIQALQFTEKDVYNIVHKILISPEINGKVNDWKEYEIIRSTCAKNNHSIDDCRTEDEKWHAIMETYRFDTREEAEEFLSRKHVEKNKLFGESTEVKLNSFIIADAVLKAWFDHIKSVEFLNSMTSEDSFDALVMNNLVENFIHTAQDVKLVNTMADAIAEYVNVVNIHTANESLLADLLTGIISDFVLDFGYRYLTHSEIEGAERVCQSRRLPAFNIIRNKVKPASDEALTEMFDKMASSPMTLSPSFENNYSRWMEYMIISFVSHLDVPIDFDIEANKKLEVIIDKINKDN